MTQLKSFVVWDKNVPILYSQNHGHRCPGDARGQGFSNHDVMLNQINSVTARQGFKQRKHKMTPCFTYIFQQIDWSSADMRCSNYIWVINNFIPIRVRLILEVLW